MTPFLPFFRSGLQFTLIVTVSFGAMVAQAQAQAPAVRVGEVVPRDVREIYERGLQYLVSSQNESGDWVWRKPTGRSTIGICGPGTSPINGPSGSHWNSPFELQSRRKRKTHSADGDTRLMATTRIHPSPVPFWSDCLRRGMRGSKSPTK